MKYLPHMRVSPIDEWLNLALKCRKTNVTGLNALAARIRTSYELYSTLIDDVGTKVPDSAFAAEKLLLLDYYSGAPSELARLMTMRRADTTIHECPYCGYPNIPDTLDHFIPKDEWPEYAFLADNLVPQCRGCAPTKGQHYFCDIENSAKFIHPFYCDLISKLTFHVSMVFAKPVPAFSVDFKSKGTLSADQKQRLVLHIKHLKIRTRIISYCHKSFNHWLDLVRKTGVDASIAFSQRLEEKGGAGMPSENWDHAFFHAVLNNKDAMDYLLSERKLTRNNVVEPLSDLGI